MYWIYCTYCAYCMYCIYIVYIVYIVYLVHIVHCMYCIYCTYCAYCIHCMYSIYCIYCISCTYCTYCTYCIHCIGFADTNTHAHGLRMFPLKVWQWNWWGCFFEITCLFCLSLFKLYAIYLEWLLRSVLDASLNLSYAYRYRCIVGYCMTPVQDGSACCRTRERQVQRMQMCRRPRRTAARLAEHVRGTCNEFSPLFCPRAERHSHTHTPTCTRTHTHTHTHIHTHTRTNTHTHTHTHTPHLLAERAARMRAFAERICSASPLLIKRNVWGTC